MPFGKQCDRFLALIANTDLRKRKMRGRVPLSPPSPIGLGGVGDTKGVLESAFRDRDIKWVTNAKLDRDGRDRGGGRWTAKASAHLAIQIHDVHPRFSLGLLHDGRGWKGACRSRQSSRLYPRRQMPAPATKSWRPWEWRSI